LEQELSASVPAEAERFQILSLDGGGIRGVFSAAILAAIEEDLNVHLVDHFDLIAGTSTGGIIALALGLGLRPADILAFYIEHGPRIFSNPLGLRSALWKEPLPRAKPRPHFAGRRRCRRWNRRPA